MRNVNKPPFGKRGHGRYHIPSVPQGPERFHGALWNVGGDRFETRRRRRRCPEAIRTKTSPAAKVISIKPDF